MWQALYQELQAKNFVPIAVAFDSAGVAAAEPWIKAASPTYPALIDRKHIVAELYDMVNVPNAVWIDERGTIVRPSEPAGANDSFRKMNRTDFSIPPDALAELQAKRNAYLAALRDWVDKSSASKFAPGPEQVLVRMHTPSDDHVRAAANFRLGEYLVERGEPQAAKPYFDEAKRLRPDSWNYKRQAWALEDPAKAGGPEFWAAVDALGANKYYPGPDDI